MGLRKAVRRSEKDSVRPMESMRKERERVTMGSGMAENRDGRRKAAAVASTVQTGKRLVTMVDTRERREGAGSEGGVVETHFGMVKAEQRRIGKT